MNDAAYWEARWLFAQEQLDDAYFDNILLRKKVEELSKERCDFDCDGCHADSD